MTPAPLREVRPLPVPAQFWIQAPLISALFSPFSTSFLFLINVIGYQLFFIGSFVRPPDLLVIVAFWMAFGFGFVGIMFLAWMKVFVESGKTMYSIYPDRIETAEGLWIRYTRTVAFDRVKDVELTEGVLQKTRGVGTVKLVTWTPVLRTNDFFSLDPFVFSGVLFGGRLFPIIRGDKGKRGIVLRNVPQPCEVYDLIRSLTQSANLPKTESLPDWMAQRVEPKQPST